MKQYLLSVYRPDDLVLDPPVMEVFVRKLDALLDEMKAAGAWVFSGGLDDIHIATVAQLQGDEVVTTDGPSPSWAASSATSTSPRRRLMGSAVDSGATSPGPQFESI